MKKVLAVILMAPFVLSIVGTIGVAIYQGILADPVLTLIVLAIPVAIVMFAIGGYLWEGSKLW